VIATLYGGGREGGGKIVEFVWKRGEGVQRVGGGVKGSGIRFKRVKYCCLFMQIFFAISSLAHPQVIYTIIHGVTKNMRMKNKFKFLRSVIFTMRICLFYC